MMSAQGRRWPWSMVLGTLLLAGCSLDSLLGTEKLPQDVSDPGTIETPDGAGAAYRGALIDFQTGFHSVVHWGGVLTDELELRPTASPGRDEWVDRRYLPEGDASAEWYAGFTYASLQRARNQARHAAELLKRYAPGSETLVAHMYTVQAYTEIFLADLFCSGIPLSTLDFEGDFTYRPGSTTIQVYEHALALLDTALTSVGDSAGIEHLTRVGRGRTLLVLGRFDEATDAVADVPDDFRYEISYLDSFLMAAAGDPRTPWEYTVGDREGINGLDYVSSGDPRTRATLLGTDDLGRPVYHPAKYPRTKPLLVVLASGIEARLIEAEAALRAGDVSGWLEKLNHLRRTAWTTITPAVSGPLADLEDPGSDAARVDLLFRERAFWLYLTGQRQGDLRRLLGHYGRRQEQIYPVGAYTASRVAGFSYGRFVDLPIPASERVSNPRFNGCLSRDG